MTLSPELLNAIEAGCDGVTPGPWRVKDANRIACLDYDVVLELVAGYRAGLKAHADVIRLRALLARIRFALEVPHV
jgi:hypothetical protein